MSESHTINEIERRVQRSVYQDGLVEVFAGLFLVIFGTLFQVDVKLSGISVLLIFVFYPALERIKQRWIYPRSGYVNLRQDPKDIRGIPLVAGLAIVGLIAILLVSIQLRGVEAGNALFLDYLMPPIIGILLAIGPWWMAKERFIRRGQIWAAMFVLMGFAFPISQIWGGYEAVGLSCTVVGASMLVTGLAIFVNFVRQKPVLEGSHGAH